MDKEKVLNLAKKYENKIIELKKNIQGKSMSIEGGEGSGKGTLVDSIMLICEHYNLNVAFTREPGGVKIAEQIRTVIVDKENTSMTPITEMLLFASARNQHLEQKVFPLLRDGAFVIFDRFVDSSYVYQGITRDIGLEKVIAVNNIATQGFLPNKTIILDIDPKIGLKRISDNNRDTNRLDLEDLSFHYRVRDGYHKLKDMFPERISLVNVEKTELEVLEDVLNIIFETFLREED